MNIFNENGFINLLPLAISAGSAYLGSRKQKQPSGVEAQTMDNRNPERQQIDAFLAQFLQKYGSQYQPGKAYSGKMSAPMSKFEGQGLDQFLTQFLNQPDASSQTTDVRNLLNKTITGGFDPGTSPYYQALRDTAEYNRKGAIDEQRAGAGARGKFFSQGALNKEGDINAQTKLGLNNSMLEFANNERDRQTSAVGPALNLEQYLQRLPLAKADAATTIGALPRELEQAYLEKMYQDFKRQQTELGNVVSSAGGVSSQTTQQGYPLPTLYPPQQPSTFEKFISPMIQQFLPKLISSFGL